MPLWFEFFVFRLDICTLFQRKEKRQYIDLFSDQWKRILWRWTLSHPSPWVSQVACTLHGFPWKRQRSYSDPGSHLSLSLSLALLLSKITRYLQIPRYFEHRWKICRMTRNRMALLDTQRRKDERFPRYSRIPGRKIDLSVITWTNILGMFVNIWKKGALMSLCMYYHVLMIK